MAGISNYIPIIAAALSIVMLCLFYIRHRRMVRQLASERRDFRTAATQSGRMLRIYSIKDDLLINTYREDSISWEPTPGEMVAAGNVAPESVAEYLEFYKSIRRGEPSGAANARLRDAHGEFRWYHAEYTLVYDESGTPDHAVVTLYENSEQMLKELAYELRRNEIAALKESSFYYLEADLVTGRIETTHGGPINLDSFDSPEMSLHTLMEWGARNSVHPDDAADFLEFFDKNRLISLHAQGVYSDSLEFRVTVDGELTWSRATVQMVKHPYTDDIKIYIVFNDIAEEHSEMEQLIGMALGDSLTGLLNRETTMQEIENYLLGDGALGVHALFMIDIDNFKLINDTLGHQVGDAVLAELSATIRGCFRENDIVGRIGGDEFFAFMKNVDKPGVVLNKARELTTGLQCVYAVRESKMDLSASIGITIYHGDREPRKMLNLLYAEADAALYKAKAIGKNCFSFADELDSVAAPVSAAQGAAALNLHTLLNNLGGGIEIFHGEPDGTTASQFCNESFLRIIGMSEEEYFKVYGKNAFAGVHPEDFESFTDEFNAALTENRHFQYLYRIYGKGGMSRWVNATVNFVKYADGSYDAYAIYSDAEQAVHEREALAAKYSVFEGYRGAVSSDTLASFHLNLSADLMCECVSSLPKMLSKQSIQSADDFFESVLADIDSSEAAAAYLSAYSRKKLISLYHTGEAPRAQAFPFLVEPGKVMWLRLSAELVENPDTRDIEALIRFFDVDRETRMQFIMKQLVGTDYEFLGQIDVRTGRITVFGGNTELEFRLKHSAPVDYRTDVPEILRAMIPDDFYEDCVAALSIERIVAELEKADTYLCTFPTKECGKMSAGIRQWRCVYLGERGGVIMMSRTNVTDTLGGETDALTGLYNQQGFCRRVREALNARPDVKFRIQRFDIDNFKLLNDTLGYGKGDQLLRDFGSALRRRAARLGANIIFAHIGADHFVSFRPDDGPSPKLLFMELSQWLEAYPLDFAITSHMGVYLITEPGMDVTAMCDRALLALRSVKQSVSERVGYYTESLRDKLVEDQALISQMGEALAAEQFEIYFQPQINYEDGSLIGAEALVRWNHPTRGLLTPEVFIPLFENNGFISELDKYVWEKSCEYIRKWMDDSENFVPVSVSVNISRIDIYNRRLCDMLKEITARHGVPVSMLKLEITESAYMRSPEQLISTVTELRAEGFTIEMDDFGSGWSSLNTLKDVHVNVLKLDLRFLSQGMDDERGGNILSSVIRMAHWLKIPVIAEGVETKQQADYLKSLGCIYMQGFYFAKPMPADRFEELLMRSRLGQPDRYDGIDLEGVAAFWNPSAQTALLFNSFVGGAAILEYRAGSAEIVRANDKFYQELGTKRSEYLGKQLRTFSRFSGKSRDIFRAMLEEAILTKGEAECEVQSLPLSEEADALPFWTHNRVRLLAKNGGRYLFYLATENITGRKELEARLITSRRALQSAIVQTGHVICGYDIAAHELTIPAEYAKKLGVPDVVMDIHLGKNNVIPEDKQRFIDFFGRIHSGEPSGSVLLRISEDDRCSYTWERLDFTTVFSEAGEPLHSVITCENVTLQKKREIESICNNIIIEHMGISLIDYDVISDSLHFRSILRGEQIIETEFAGYLAGELDTEKSRIHPQDKAAHRAFFRRLAAGSPESGQYEFRADNWGMGYVQCRLNYVSIGDDDGRVYRVVGQVTKIQDGENNPPS